MAAVTRIGRDDSNGGTLSITSGTRTSNGNGGGGNGLLIQNGSGDDNGDSNNGSNEAAAAAVAAATAATACTCTYPGAENVKSVARELIKQENILIDRRLRAFLSYQGIFLASVALSKSVWFVYVMTIPALISIVSTLIGIYEARMAIQRVINEADEEMNKKILYRLIGTGNLRTRTQKYLMPGYVFPFTMLFTWIPLVVVASLKGEDLFSNVCVLTSDVSSLHSAGRAIS